MTPKPRHPWILEETFRLLKANPLQRGDSDRARKWGNAENHHLSVYQKQWFAKVARSVEAHMAIWGAYECLQPWYRSFKGRASVPLEETMAATQAVYKDLFQAEDSAD